MIAKILSSTSTFNAVNYNTRKIDSTKGELMSVMNFGILSNDLTLKPDEVKKYLKFHSSTNTRVKDKQFHATLSAKGKEHSKEELTNFAHQWMSKMGYSDNPYIVVFHNDTDNHHVHIVSSRIGIDGKKINDSMEQYRAVDAIAKILNQNQTLNHSFGIDKYSSYSYSNLSQLALLIERDGYSITQNKDDWSIYKGKKMLESFPVANLNSVIKDSSYRSNHINVVKALIEKYRYGMDATLHPEYNLLAGGRKGKVKGYKSELTDYLRKTFGIEILFHHKGSKPPYGYTLIDHKHKAVYKGGEIIPLKKIVSTVSNTTNVFAKDLASISKFNIDSKNHKELLAALYRVPVENIKENDKELSKTAINYYKNLVDFRIKTSGIFNLEQAGLLSYKIDQKLYFVDPIKSNIIQAESILSEEQLQELQDRGEVHAAEYTSHSKNLSKLLDPTAFASIASSSNRKDETKRKKRKI